ncbi:hypothetical protein EDB89DRAFT_1905728 [Lactarius sanguifluus]|nr:hypothetical protein EDB89DRAFT_1911388 [Lactarius sanguifluus]KAH9172822.1 hypothetical protein EDB89DRAFT_1905728 [Lactarius sanguifluus]
MALVSAFTFAVERSSEFGSIVGEMLEGVGRHSSRSSESERPSDGSTARCTEPSPCEFEGRGDPAGVTEGQRVENRDQGDDDGDGRCESEWTRLGASGDEIQAK